MKRQIFLLILVFSLFTGCSQNNNKSDSSMTVGHAVIGTSDAVFDLGWKLSRDFQTGNRGAFIDIVRQDNRSLVDSLANKRVEEIFMDRTLTQAESLIVTQQKMKIYSYPIAYFPVYLLVQKTNPVESIDSIGLRKALTGEITNWKDLNGEELPLRVYIPLLSEGAWFSIVNFYGVFDSVDAVVCSTAAEMAEKSKKDMGALLIYPLPYADMSFKKLQFDSVAANVKTIIEEPIYPFKLTITYISTHNKSDVAAGFLTFAVGNTGQRSVMNFSYRPASVPVRVVKMKVPQ